MLTLNDGRNELWQWDTNRKLTVDADCSQVHFSNKVFGRSIDVDVVDGVAIIPDILLQTDKELNAWAFVGTPENGYTKISKVFKVNRRNKPSDYVFTPPEQTSLGELIERLDKIEEEQIPDAVKNAVEDYLEKNPVDVQSVNGKTGAVQLSASDVGARPDNWMPTAQEVGALPSTYTPPNQTAEQVGADPKGTATTLVSQHNTADDSHNDIRLELKAINDRLTAFFDSDDQTLDELSEIVSYITNNKTLIESITTSKVSVADIIDNLTTNVANKPLSASQGVVLKGLIDTLSNSLSNYQTKGDYALRSELPTVPTNVSAFTNDAGYLTEHQDISGKLDASELPSAINSALAQAKASGEFDGKDGKDGKDGEDYVLTNEDKQEIAEMAAELVDVPDSGGNVDLTGYATEKYVREYAQPKGDYLTEVPEGYAKTEDIPAKPEDIGAQPAGNYLTEVPIGYATEEFVKNKIAEAELGCEEVDLSGYAKKSELPTKVSELKNDAGYLTEHQDISGKLDASALPTAINTALAQAKASGEFDGQPGADGKDGVSATHSWSGTVLTVTSASGTSSANLKGDKGEPGEKGADGAKGDKGDKGDTGATGPAYTLTDTDKNSIATSVKNSLYTYSPTDLIAGTSALETGKLHFVYE